MVRGEKVRTDQSRTAPRPALLTDQHEGLGPKKTRGNLEVLTRNQSQIEFRYSKCVLWGSLEVFFTYTFRQLKMHLA